MNYSFGMKSRHKLDTCHQDLVTIAELAIDLSPYDITIIHGYRGSDVQNALFDSGASQKQYPHSKHNATDRDGVPESRAIDFAPWVNGTIAWGDTHIFAVIAGIMMAIAAQIDVDIRWGGDWDSDGLTSDQTLMDWGHMELL